MLFTEVLGTLRRRWIVVVVGLVLTAAASVGVFKLVHPKYTLTREVLLLPPQSETPAGANPLLSLGGLGSAVDVLARALSDDSSVTEMQAKGAVGTFSTARDQTTSAPMLQISVTTNTPAEARTTATVLTDAVPARLAALQGDLGVPAASHVTSTVLTNNTEPEASRKSQLQAVVGMFALGVLLTILLASFIDRLARRRAARGPRRSSRGREDDPGEQGATTADALPGSAPESVGVLVTAVAAPVAAASLPTDSVSATVSENLPSTGLTEPEPAGAPNATAPIPMPLLAPDSVGERVNDKARAQASVAPAYTPAAPARRAEPSREPDPEPAAADSADESAVAFESWY